MTFFQNCVMAFCLLISCTANAEKLSVWEGKTTFGKCKKEKLSYLKTNLKTSNAEAKAGRPLQAAKIIRSLEQGLYSHCLRSEFKKALSHKIAKAKKLAVGKMKVSEAGLFDKKFVQLLFNSAHYLDNIVLKDIAKMALSFHVKDGTLGVVKNYVFLKEVKPIRLP